MCVSVAHLYLRNASRTNKTPAAGIVRVAQRKANTDRERGDGTVRYRFSFNLTPRDRIHSHFNYTN